MSRVIKEWEYSDRSKDRDKWKNPYVPKVWHVRFMMPAVPIVVTCEKPPKPTSNAECNYGRKDDNWKFRFLVLILVRNE